MRFFIVLLCLWSGFIQASESDNGQAFFNSSFGNLTEELQAAKQQGKQGIILFFEMEGCPYCRAMRQNLFTQTQVQQAYQQKFLIFPIDIKSDVELTDFAGKQFTQKTFAAANRVRSTPTTIFYDLQGQELYRFVGMSQNSQEFLRLADYVLNKQYQQRSFKDYQRQTH
jgi:thioredoxin-related protein